MSFKTITVDKPSATAEVGAFDLSFEKNALTTTGTVMAIGTIAVGGAVATAVVPFHMVAGTAIAAGLIYAGDRADKGLPIIPTFTQDETVTQSE